MKTYSHSKLSAFEQCKLKYKFRYIDNIIIVEKTVESFLGKIVHSALEWLYLEVRKGIVPTLDELIMHYAREWRKEFDFELIINGNLSIDDYYNKGIKFLADYYIEYAPFDDNTIDIEKEIIINLDEEGKYRIRGFIDRLVYNLKTNSYEVHDYKTSNSIPSQEKIDSDRQLALYSIAIKNLFGEDKDVLLVWHFLAYNQRVYSKRTNEKLKELKKEIIETIDRIESAKEFPPYVSKLCNWCEYKNICPGWGNSPDKEKRKREFNETLDVWD